MKLRASGMDTAMACPGSARAPCIRIRETSEPAELGTAAHLVYQDLVETGIVHWSHLPALAERYSVDETDLRVLAAQGQKLWYQVRDAFPSPFCEVALGPVAIGDATLTGHVDVVSIVDSEARICDWKTGRKDADYRHQMRAYGALVLAEHPELVSATTTLLWVRDGEVETNTMTREQAERWLHRVQTHVVDWNGTYCPGTHCQWCASWYECKAAHAMTRAAVSAIIEAPADQLAAMTPADIVQLYQRASLVGNVADKVRDALREHVKHVGPVEANGQRLEIAIEERRELDPMAAWPVLEGAGFGDAEFAQVLKISASETEKLVAARAGRGRGAAAVRELKAALDNAGAVKLNQISKLTLRRAG